jgi:hypothetical protein
LSCFWIIGDPHWTRLQNVFWVLKVNTQK